MGVSGKADRVPRWPTLGAKNAPKMEHSDVGGLPRLIHCSSATSDGNQGVGRNVRCDLAVLRLRVRDTHHRGLRACCGFPRAVVAADTCLHSHLGLDPVDRHGGSLGSYSPFAAAATNM